MTGLNSESTVHPGWHSRGYLPHFDEPGLTQMLTFRLADSLSAESLAALKARCPSTAAATYLNSVEAELDRGGGECWLRQAAIAETVENSLLCFDAARYRLLCWVIMPNHVHTVIETFPGWTVGSIVGGWKSYSGRLANRQLGKSGAFWQADYFDRYIRDSHHLEDAAQYIHLNPVKAGLCLHPRDWRWSSYRRIHEP